MKLLALCKIISNDGENVYKHAKRTVLSINLIKNIYCNLGRPPAINCGPVHTAPVSDEKGAKLTRFGLAFTLLQCEHGAC